VATNIASLQATLRLVTDQWTAGLNKGASEVDAFSKSVEGKAANAGKAFDKFRESVRANEGAFAALGISATKLEGQVLRAMRSDVVKAFTDSVRGAETETSRLGESLKRIGEIALGVTFAHMFERGVEAIRDFIKESAKLGLEATIQEDAFKHLTEAAGVAGETLLKKMQEASGGVLNISDVMRAASAALIEGLQPEQIVKLMEIARQQSKLTGDTVADAFNKITEAIATQRERSLKQLLINADMAGSIKNVAMSLGLQSDELSKGEKIQASFAAVNKATTATVEALSKSTSGLKEAVEKAAGQWKQFKEDVGKPLAAFGIGVLTTVFAEVEALVKRLSDRLGDIGPQLTDIKTVWGNTWKSALEALRPVAAILENTLIPVFKVLGLSAMGWALAFQAAMAFVAKDVAQLGSILGDISSGKLPDFKKATEAGNTASAEAAKRLTETSDAMLALQQSTVGLARETKTAASAIEVGKNKLGDFQPPLRGAAGDALKLAEAIRAVGNAFDKELMLPREADVFAITEPFRKLLESLQGLSPVARETLMNWARGSAAAAVGLREMKQAHDAEIAAMTEDLAGRLKYEEMLTRGNEHLREMSILIRQVEQDETRESDVAEAASKVRVATMSHLGDETDRLKQQLLDLQNQTRLSGGAMDVQAVAAQLLGRNFETLTPEIQQVVQGIVALKARITELQGEAFANELRQIADQAFLLGPAFHEGDATLEAVKRRMLEVAAAGRGQMTPELAALKAQFDALRSPAEKAAEAIDRVFKDRQREIDAWTTVGESQQRFFEQGLAGAAAYSRAIGDFAGFFDATFTAALTKGTDTFSNLKTLAEGVAGDIKSAFGSFFTDFKAGLDQGLGFWQSFTGAMSSLWNNLMNSLIKRFSDFLVNMAIEAATTQNAGGALGGLLALFSGGRAATLTQPGPMVDAGGAPILNTNGTQSASTNIAGIASTGVSLIGIVSKLGAVWDAARVAFDAFMLSYSTLNTSFLTAAKYAFNTLPQLGTTLQVVGGVATAVGIALTAMRNDITDTGKAIQTSLQAAAYVLITFGEFWGKVVGVALLAVSFILEFTGIFEKASKEWLQFPGKLAHTLGEEQKVLTAFGADLVKSTDLVGVAKSIETFRQSIDHLAGGFFAATAGQGVFHVPGIPGATGNEHEGGIAFNFNPYIQEIQDAIDKVLNQVRDTISIKFADAAKQAMPADLFNAFRTGTIEPLRQSFEDLVSSTTATIEDVKKFEDRMKEVGALLVAFVQVSAGLANLGVQAKKVLPDDLFGPLVSMGQALNQQLIDLASSGKATTEDLKNMAAAVDSLKQLVLAFAQEALQLRELSAVAGEVLPAALATAVQAIAGGLRQALVDLAKSGTATAADLQELEAKINALATGVALYQTLTTVIAGLTNDFAALTQASINGAHAAIAAADRAITDARDMMAKAVDGPELATAAQNLYNSIIAKYALEAKLISDISKEISDLLSKFGTQLVSTAMVAVTYGLERGSTAALQGLLTALDGIQVSAFSATTRIWAAVQALGALAASVPSIVKGFGGKPGANPMDLAMGLYNAALPSLTTLANLFVQTRAAGDLKGALDILGQGAAAITALGNAAIAGVEQWLQQANAAAASLAQGLIDAETSAAKIAIEGVNAQLALDEKVDAVKLDALNKQKAAAEKIGAIMREVASADASLVKFLTNLRLGPQAPPDPFGQFNLAKSLYQQALGRFNPAAPTGKSIQDVQEAAQALLTAAQPVMARASAEYRELFADVTAGLDAVHAAALNFVTPEEEAAASLKAIDDEIQALNEHTKKIRDDAAAAVKAIEATRDANIKAIEQQRDAIIAANQKNAERTIDGIKEAVGNIMGVIAKEEFRLLGLLVGQQEDIMSAITGGLDPLVFQLQEQKAERIALENLRDIIYAALTNSPLPKIPVPAGPDTAARRVEHFATGGIAWGPTLAVIGERRPEVVSDLDAWRTWRPSVLGRSDVAHAVPAGVGGRSEESARGGHDRPIQIINHFPNARNAREIQEAIAQSAKAGVIKSAVRQGRRASR
jgi:hypothetical protein